MSNALSWADASADCQAAGLQLASVQSAEQNALLLTAAAGNSVWIGGTDAASEGRWVWSPTNTPLSYTNWNAGEPNNRGSEDCMQFYGDTGKWNDLRCAKELKYVCQTACPVPSPPSPPPPCGKYVTAKGGVAFSHHCPPPSPPSSPPHDCATPLDFVLVLDESFSMKDVMEGVGGLKAFAKELVRHYSPPRLDATEADRA